MRIAIRLSLWLVAVVALVAIILFIPTRFWIENATSIKVSELGNRTIQGFPIKPYGDCREILKEKTIDSSAAKSVSTALLSSIDQDSAGALCHYPVYGLQFYIGPVCTFETSICFKCHNFYDRFFIFYGWRGLDPVRQVELQKILQRLLPISTEQDAAANP